MTIRSTPVDSSLPSPFVLLQGRNLRGSLPFMHSALQPKIVIAAYVKQQIQQRQAVASFAHARSPDARGSLLEVGQPVRVRVSRKWIPGRVSSVFRQPHSYVVTTANGREYQRTRRAINVVRTGSSNSHPGRNIEECGGQPTAAGPTEVPTPSIGQLERQGPFSPARPAELSVVSGSPFHGFEPVSSTTNTQGVTRSGRSYLAPPHQLVSAELEN